MIVPATRPVDYFCQEIIDDATHNDVYVHHSGLIDKVRKGDKVEFAIDHNEQGMIAKDVKKVQKG